MTKIFDPKTHLVPLLAVAQWLLPHLPAMRVEDIKDALTGAIQTFIHLNFYRSVRCLKDGEVEYCYEQERPVPQRYSDALQEINDIYEENVSADKDDTVQKRCREAFYFYCYEIILRSEGLGTTLR